MVGLGFAVVVLDVDPGVTGPWGLEDGVRATGVPSWSEEVLTETEEVGVVDVAGIGSHGGEDLGDARHGSMVPLMVLPPVGQDRHR